MNKVYMYKIIAEEKALAEFLAFLPDTKEDESYYFQLFARKKYCNLKIKNGHNCLSRFACKKKDIVNKIRKLELPFGTYTVEGQDVPQEALALYVTINPRSEVLAAKNLIKTLVDRMCEPYNGYRVQDLAYREIHKSAGTKHFVDFDFDDVTYNADLEQKFLSILNPDSFKIVITRGGFHALVMPSKVEEKYKKGWYQGLTALGPDIKGDNMIPVVGCYQGGFVPRFVGTNTRNKLTLL